MHGLGPNGTSLIQRVGRIEDPQFLGVQWIEMEQKARGKARLIARIKHQQKHKMVKKPEAPVLPLGDEKGEKRVWLWNGESIGSKSLYNGYEYLGSEIRSAGFKLPKLMKKVK